MFTRRTIEGYRIIKNPEHGFTGDRDRVACINLFLNSRCTGSSVPANTTSQMQAREEYRGTRMK
ncbi:hypothetical protein DKAM_1454 [Desulfurococcus amylolyticus 1221n]|uniref:Uncharacterized protein n=1 Tax=Desulfurococcus amylolyticus (strain DSM 18924 / JCM 16383 / VKM B-2413 / 1221n) TaxID=490899 RepID=B8D6P9_DESA1|nr:hypothetical protein [Desulfurococcus amylolyticus]ACL11780.1 hypothetical protein DKAM_1454 [Desulfurococcus amylolyticus 1221n]